MESYSLGNSLDVTVEDSPTAEQGKDKSHKDKISFKNLES